MRRKGHSSSDPYPQVLAYRPSNARERPVGRCVPCFEFFLGSPPDLRLASGKIELGNTRGARQQSSLSRCRRPPRSFSSRGDFPPISVSKPLEGNAPSGGDRQSLIYGNLDAPPKAGPGKQRPGQPAATVIRGRSQGLRNRDRGGSDVRVTRTRFTVADAAADCRRSPSQRIRPTVNSPSGH